VQRQVERVEQRECGAERVARHGDGRATMFREDRVNGRENRLCRPGLLRCVKKLGLAEMRPRARVHARWAYFLCSFSNPLCTLIERERPGKSDASRWVLKISRSVRSALLEGEWCLLVGRFVWAGSSLTIYRRPFPGVRR
jgi:hypothetical protein